MTHKPTSPASPASSVTPQPLPFGFGGPLPFERREGERVLTDEPTTWRGTFDRDSADYLNGRITLEEFEARRTLERVDYSGLFMGMARRKREQAQPVDSGAVTWPGEREALDGLEGIMSVAGVEVRPCAYCGKPKPINQWCDCPPQEKARLEWKQEQAGYVRENREVGVLHFEKAVTLEVLSHLLHFVRAQDMTSIEHGVLKLRNYLVDGVDYTRPNGLPPTGFMRVVHSILPEAPQPHGAQAEAGAGAGPGAEGEV